MVYPGFDLERMRAAVRRHAIEWHRHALEQMARRGLTLDGVREALVAGECIEAYPTTGRPFPDALLLGWFSGRPIHIVAAFDAAAEWTHVITVYEPDLDHFAEDFRTRRR